MLLIAPSETTVASFKIISYSSFTSHRIDRYRRRCKIKNQRTKTEGGCLRELFCVKWRKLKC